MPRGPEGQFRRIAVRTLHGLSSESAPEVVMRTSSTFVIMDLGDNRCNLLRAARRS